MECRFRKPLDKCLGKTYVTPVQVEEERSMATVVTTYTDVRARLAAFCSLVSSSREAVIIKRRNAEDVALVSAEELESLLETAHLLRSPRNAERLMKALGRAKAKKTPPSSVRELRERLGLDK